MQADSGRDSSRAPEAVWRVDTLSGLRLPPGVIERSDGTLETIGVRVHARRGSSVRACLHLAATIWVTCASPRAVSWQR
jgi:hypothetical protein